MAPDAGSNFITYTIPPNTIFTGFQLSILFIKSDLVLIKRTETTPRN